MDLTSSSLTKDITDVASIGKYAVYLRSHGKQDQLSGTMTSHTVYLKLDVDDSTLSARAE